MLLRSGGIGEAISYFLNALVEHVTVAGRPNLALGHIRFDFVERILQHLYGRPFVLQRADAHRERLDAFCGVVILLLQQILLRCQLGRVEFEFRNFTLDIGNGFVEFILNFLDVLEQLEHGAVQPIQAGHLSAHVEVGAGQALLLRFQAVQSITDVMTLQLVDLPFHRPLSNVQVVHLLPNEALMPHSVVGEHLALIC